MASPLPLQHVYDNFFDVVSHRRSKRVLTGRNMPTYFDYTPSKPPEPLSKAETALLCYAAAGVNGLISNDMPGLPAVSSLQGRTFPSPDNSQKTHLLFSNDEGLWLYEPKPTTRVWRVEKPDDLQEIIDSFDDDVIRLQGTRKDLDPAWMGASSQANHPGSTTFFPVVMPGDAVIKFLGLSLFEYLGYLYVDDEGNPAGCGPWVDKLGLKHKVPLSVMVKQVVDWCNLEAGFIAQNLMLAGTAMALGTSPFAGMVSAVLMGGTPMARGFGFHFVTDRRGAMNPIGIDGVLEGVTPPYVDLDQAAENCILERFRAGGAYNVDTPSPFKDQRGFVEATPRYSDDMIDCLKSVLRYVYDREGRFPMGADTMTIPMGINIHHVDSEFYERFYKPEFTTLEEKQHHAVWHGTGA